MAVPRHQPASVALVAGRRAEDGEFEAWRKQAAAARLAVAEDGAIRFTGGDGTRAEFVPGRRAAFAGRPVEASAYSRMDSPFLSSRTPGKWSFAFEKVFRPAP